MPDRRVTLWHRVAQRFPSLARCHDPTLRPNPEDLALRAVERVNFEIADSAAQRLNTVRVADVELQPSSLRRRRLDVVDGAAGRTASPHANHECACALGGREAYGDP